MASMDKCVEAMKLFEEFGIVEWMNKECSSLSSSVV